jgi:hypothetical protein
VRMAKATTPPAVRPITALLSDEQTVRYLNLAVDSYALKNRRVTEENERLRRDVVLIQAWARSMERRVEQVLLHRWRSRIWSALLATVVVLALDGTIAGWFA